MLMRGLADIEAWERVPLEQRLKAANVYEALAAAAEASGDKPAIHWLADGSAEGPVVTYSYADFLAAIRRSANLFHSLGLAAGDVVSLLLPIGPETFFCLFGAEIAFVANPINPFLATEHIIAILRQAGTKVLIGCDAALQPGIWEKVEAARAALPEIKAVIRIGGTGRSVKPPVIDYAAAVAEQPGDRLLMPHTRDPKAVAALFHTGGTTGLPKLARHTHQGAVTQGHTNSVIADPAADAVMLNGLPPFHVGGTMCGGMAPLTSGQTVVLLSPLGMRNPAVVRDYWRIAERFKATALGAVPTSWAALLTVPVAGADLSHVRFGLTGGSSLPAEIGQAVERKLGFRIIEGYGMTELHGYVTMTPPGAPSRFGSAGVRAPYHEVLIVKLKADGTIERTCPTGEIGVVLWRGPQVFGGYLDPKHDRDALVEGWLNSGDLGRLDEDGYLWLTGRAKDLIIRGGHNIDPQMIEDVLYQHPEVETAAAVGRPDRYAGEIPVAFVQLKPGGSITAEALQAFVREHIPERAAAPAEIFLTQSMPVTAVGKIFKPQLRYLAAETAFSRDLAPLAAEGLAIAVTVGPHDRHGTQALIRIRSAVPDRPAVEGRPAVESRIADLLAGYPLRHEIAWE